MLKKVYIEITNNCNLNCSFCTLKKKKNKVVSVDEFNIILDKLKGHTNYLYFHVLGEPLLHPNINELIDLAKNNNFNVNITTNGYFINKIKYNENIRQINISLHSYTDNISIDDYLNNIFDSVNNLSKYTYISYRIWTKNKYIKDIIDRINKYYSVNIDINNLKNIKIKDNIFFHINEEFIWPSLDNNIYKEDGMCHGLRDHIGILSDGTVIPCCLDGEGIINLGNIYSENLYDILNSYRALNMINKFKENKRCEELCKHCDFIK